LTAQELSRPVTKTSEASALWFERLYAALRLPFWVGAFVFAAGGFLAILVALWEYPPIRVVMIAFIAVIPVLLLQVFFWYLPRLRDIHRLTFDEWRERIVMLRSGRPFVT